MLVNKEGLRPSLAARVERGLRRTCEWVRQVEMSNRGASVAVGVRRGLGLAARWSRKTCGAGGAGPSIGWRSDHAESRASGGCERCAGLEEKEGGVLARDAWAAGGEACSAADGTSVARCSGACGWAGLGRSWALGIVPFDGLSAGDLNGFFVVWSHDPEFLLTT